MKYTLDDIAKACGVSKATVSKIINNKETGYSEATKKLVLKKIEELNFRPNSLARSISVSNSKLIGVIVPSLKNLVHVEILDGIEVFLTENGYSAIVAQSHNDEKQEEKLIVSMVDNRVDGIILLSGISDPKFLQKYKQYNIRIALVGRNFEKEFSDVSIGGDNFKGGSIATEYFLDQGHKNIALLDGKFGISGTKQRHMGYEYMLKERNIKYNKKLVKFTDFSMDDGYRMAKELIESKQEFSAIITGGDLIAIGAIQALNESGIKVPEDVEVMGYDDIEIARIHTPQLSSITKPDYGMGRMIAEMLVKKIEGETVPVEHLLITPSISLRDTTK